MQHQNGEERDAPALFHSAGMYHDTRLDGRPTGRTGVKNKQGGVVQRKAWAQEKAARLSMGSARAKPKSQSWMMPPFATRMFCGFRSRWMTLLACR